MPANKKPMKHVWMVEDPPHREAKNGSTALRSFWTKIGVAYDNADRSVTLQRGSLGLIEPGAGISGEPKKHRRRVAVATCRGRDAGIAVKTKPCDASTQVIPAVELAAVPVTGKIIIRPALPLPSQNAAGGPEGAE